MDLRHRKVDQPVKFLRPILELIQAGEQVDEVEFLAVFNHTRHIEFVHVGFVGFLDKFDSHNLPQ